MAKFGRRGSKAIPLWVRFVDVAILSAAGYIELTLAQFNNWMLFGVAVLIEAAALYLWFWLRRRFTRNPYFYSHHFEFTNDGVRIVNKNGDSIFIPRDLALSEMRVMSTMRVQDSSQLLLGMMAKPTPSGYTGSTSIGLGRCYLGLGEGI